jgi:hypothetical protein
MRKKAKNGIPQNEKKKPLQIASCDPTGKIHLLLFYRSLRLCSRFYWLQVGIYYYHNNPNHQVVNDLTTLDLTTFRSQMTDGR